MNTNNTHEVTRLLMEWGNGDQAAYEELARMVYAELHRIAERQMRKERNGHTLNPSALVNEAFLKLFDYSRIQWQDRLHFFNFAARLMRQVLVNYANARNSRKRWGGTQRAPFDEVLAQANRREVELDDLLALDEALEHLAEEDKRCAEVVELLYFGGLSEKEAAEVLNVSERTVKRDWRYARLWLRRELSRGEEVKDEPRT
ncbi:MAG: sigma-70 family RNA polymerase sigma factor [Blastocatellales bacterium]